MKLFLLLLIFPFHLMAQPSTGSSKDFTGTWQGFVTTTEKKLPYELVIGLKEGILVGYSLTRFTVDNQENISLKKVNLKFKDDEIIAEDDDVIFDNLKKEAAKKIKQVNKLKLNDDGEHWNLSGTFETKIQRVLRPARGDVYLEKASNPIETTLMAKLAEMKLTDGLTFTPVQVPGRISPSPSPTTASATLPVPEISLPASIYKEQFRIVASDKKQWAATISKPGKSRLDIPPVIFLSGPVATLPEPEVPLSASNFKEQLRILPANKKQSVATVSRPVTTRVYIAPVPSITRAETAVATVPAVTPAAPAVASKEPTNAPTLAPVIKTAAANIAVAPALDLARRKIENIGQIFIEADSLLLTLYDNGEVDGDSVSLILNGKTIVSKQGLNTSAFTKTIYITPDMGDSIQLVMYAENLGSLPPNTGLLILQFDNQRQEIRFSGDLDKNAAITLRRREKR